VLYFQVDHKDHGSLLRFGALWESEYNHDSLLVYSTGRSPQMFSDLRREVPLLTAGIVILSCGSEIYYGDTMMQDFGFIEELNKGWSRPVIEEVAAEMNLKYQVEICTCRAVKSDVELLFLCQFQYKKIRCMKLYVSQFSHEVMFWLRYNEFADITGLIDELVSSYVHFVTIWQCDSEQRPHKVSFHVRKEESTYVMPMLLEKLKARGVSTTY
jgi:hypothetical protein